MANLEKRIAAIESSRRSATGHLTDEQLFAFLAKHDGYDLAMVPGDTNADKLDAIHAVYRGELTLAPEVRHAVRGWIEVLDKF